MGRSIYRFYPFRLSTFKFRLISSKCAFLTALGCTYLLCLTSCAFRAKDSQQSLSSQLEIVQPLQSVAALGQLSPLGEIRKLAAPVSGFGGTPRVLKLLINDGDTVKKGQRLAIFDSQPRILADLEGLQARLSKVEVNIKMQKKEIARYQKPTEQGAVSIVLFEQKKEELINFQGQKNELIAEIKGLEVDLANSELLSPIDGLILRLHTREGERPGSEGVLEVGASQFMQALVEVYESDISKIRIGQDVSLISENGGFRGTLMGKVERISPQVRQRKVLSTDPTGDADARIVEVQVKLLDEYTDSVSRLAGIKVIARFDP